MVFFKDGAFNFHSFRSSLFCKYTCTNYLPKCTFISEINAGAAIV